MPIEAKEIIEYLGAKPEEIDSVDKLKAHFETKFTPKDNIDPEIKTKIVSGAFHKISNQYVQDMKSIGIELAKEEIEGKKLEDQLKIGIEKFKEEKSKFEAFKATTANPSEEYKQLENKFKTLETQYNEVTGKYTGLSSEYETFKSQKENELKDFKKRTKVNDIHKSKVDFADGVPELTKKGYFTTVAELYEPDYDEKTDNVYAVDRSTGKRVPGKKAGEDKLYEEVLPEVGIKAGVWRLNNQSKNQPKEPVRPESLNGNHVVTPVRQVAKRIS